MVEDASSQGQKVPGDGTAGDEPTPKRSKVRRWRRRLIRISLVLFALAIILVMCGPLIVSSGFVTRCVMSYASGSIRGDMAVHDLSIGWFSPTHVRGIVLRDSKKRPVASVGSITLSSSLWKLLTDPYTFETITIDAPEVTVAIGADGVPSLGDALESVAPEPAGTHAAAPGVDNRLPALRGSVKVTNGVVKLVRGNAQAVAAADLNAAVTIRTLDQLQFDGDFTLLDESPVKVHAQVSGAAPEGLLEIAKATGKVSLNVAQPVTLARLAELVLPEVQVTGTASVDLDATIEPGNARADYSVKLASFSMKELTDSAIQPLDAEASGTASLANDVLDLDARLVGSPTSLHAVARADLSGGLPSVTAEQVVAAVVSGTSKAWPSLSLTLDGDVDLAALDRAVPGLLVLGHGQSITSGTVQVSSLHVSTDAVPSVKASLALKNLVMARDGRPLPLGLITLDAEAKVVQDQGLQVDRALAQTGFGSIDAAGNLDKLTLHVQGDLASAFNQIGAVVNLGTITPAGTADATIGITRVDANQLAVTVEVDGRRVAYADGSASYALGDVHLSQHAQVALEQNRPARVDLTESTIQVGDLLTVRGHGTYDVRTEAATGRVAVADTDLERLASNLRALGIEGLDPYGGHVATAMDISRQGGDAPWRVDGSATLDGVLVDRRPLLDGRTTVQWSGGSLSPDFSKAAAAEVAVASSAGSVKAQDVRYSLADGSLAATITGKAELARMMELYARFFHEEKPADLSGSLSFESSVALTDQATSFKGTAGVPALSMNQPGAAIRENDVALSYDVALEHSANRLTLGRIVLKSKRFQAEVSGTIDRLDSDMTATLRGRYTLAWRDAMDLLHQCVPDTATMINVEGISNNYFQILGPLAKGKVEPAYRDAHASTRLDWTKADVAGIELGRGSLEPTFSGGILTLPKSTISAAGGRVNLAGSVNLTKSPLRLAMPGKTVLLQGVQLTPELCRDLLSRINPIFYEVALAQGRVDLAVNDVDLPLAEDATQLGRGTGRLEFTDMKIVPAGFFSEVLALGGIAADQRVTVTVSGLDFLVQAGRIQYRNFALRLPGGFDLNFFGSVGLDGSLELTVSLPVRAALLERLGVTGRAAEYAEILSGARVDIPISGTREVPVLEMGRVDVQSLIERATQGAADRVIGGLLDDVLKKNNLKEDSPRKKSPPARTGGKKQAPKKGTKKKTKTELRRP